MKIRRAGILLGAAILISAPLVFAPQAEARGGQGTHKSGHGQYDNRGHRGRSGHHGGRRYSDERPDYYGHRHGRYRCGTYRCGGYDYYYPPHDYYYDSSPIIGLPWPYGITVIYQD